MPYLDLDDLRLYYEEEGSGPPLLLLHGGLGAIDDPWSAWSTPAPQLVARYGLLHLEHRGHGRTNNPGGRLDYATIAADVCRFVERLELAPAHVAGMSDGGIVALHIGMTRPELMRTLIGVGVNYRNDALTDEANAGLDPETVER